MLRRHDGNTFALLAPLFKTGCGDAYVSAVKAPLKGCPNALAWDDPLLVERSHFAARYRSSTRSTDMRGPP